MKNYILMVVVTIFIVAGCKPAEQSVIVPKNTATNEQAPQAITPTKESNCEFTLGMDVWEPYQYITVGNTVTGLDVELVQAVITGMGCKLNVIQGSWFELLPLLKEGDVDFVLGASKTEDREAFAYFSEPYRQERFQLYVRVEQVKEPYSDLTAFLMAGHKVGIVSDYYYGDEVTALYADKNLRSQFVGAIISELNMARLMDEDIDGLLEDSFVGASILRRKGLDKYIQPHDISLGSADVYVMFSKASVNAEQVQQFNLGLALIRDNGEYNRIVKKYSH